VGLGEDVPDPDWLLFSAGGLGLVEGVFVPGCWFWEELDAGDFLIVGEGCLRGCCELARVEDEVVAEVVAEVGWRLTPRFEVLRVDVFPGVEFLTVAELGFGVSRVGDVALDGAGITSTGMRACAECPVGKLPISNRRSIQKANTWIMIEPRITLTHSAGGSE
jgi:hypothetical protein